MTTHPLNWRTVLINDLDKFPSSFSASDALNLFMSLNNYKYATRDLILAKTLHTKKATHIMTNLNNIEKSLRPTRDRSPMSKARAKKLSDFLSAMVVLEGQVDPKTKKVLIHEQFMVTAKHLFAAYKSMDSVINRAKAHANNYSMSLHGLATIRTKHDGHYSNNIRDVVKILYSIYEDVKEISGKGLAIHDEDKLQKYMSLITDIFIRSCKQSGIKAGMSERSKKVTTSQPLVLMIHDEILKQEGYRDSSQLKKSKTPITIFDEVDKKMLLGGEVRQLLSTHLMRLSKLNSKPRRTDLDVLLVPNDSTYEAKPADSFGSVNTLSVLSKYVPGLNERFSNKVLNYSVLCVNGIQNDYEDALKNALSIARLYPARDGTLPDVHFVANPTSGGSDTLNNDASTKARIDSKAAPKVAPKKGWWGSMWNKGTRFTMDMGEAGVNKLGILTEPAFLLAASLRALYEKDPFKPILLIGHSQGGALVANALPLLNKEIRENIHAIGVAPEIYIPSKYCAESINIYIKGDPVGDRGNLSARTRYQTTPVYFTDVGHLRPEGSTESDIHTFGNVNYQKAIKMAMHYLNQGKSIRIPFADIVGTTGKTTSKLGDKASQKKT